jgi:hypothetical protein
VYFGLEHATGSYRASDSTDLSSQGAPDFGKGVEGFLRVDDDYTVVNVNADEEAEAGSVEHDARRGRPGAVGGSGYQDAGTTGTRDPESSAHSCEDGEALCILDDLWCVVREIETSLERWVDALLVGCV